MHFMRSIFTAFSAFILLAACGDASTQNRDEQKVLFTKVTKETEPTYSFLREIGVWDRRKNTHTFKSAAVDLNDDGSKEILLKTHLINKTDCVFQIHCDDVQIY